MTLSARPVRVARATEWHGRRPLALAALVVVVGIAAGVVFALRSPGGPNAVGSGGRHGLQSISGLASIAVPVDPTELHWRQWISKQAQRPVVGRSDRVRRVVESHAAASGAAVVRLRLWRTTQPPSVELVVATAIPAAVYLRHHLSQLYAGINGHYMFVEVVDARGSKFFQSALRLDNGTAYIRPGLQGCAAGFITGLAGSSPCPAH
jgi:hypothetical protein